MRRKLAEQRHTHRCKCGKRWTHTPRRDWSAEEHDDAHTCPRCGKRVIFIVMPRRKSPHRARENPTGVGTAIAIAAATAAAGALAVYLVQRFTAPKPAPPPPKPVLDFQINWPPS